MDWDTRRSTRVLHCEYSSYTYFDDVAVRPIRYSNVQSCDQTWRYTVILRTNSNSRDDELGLRSFPFEQLRNWSLALECANIVGSNVRVVFIHLISKHQKELSEPKREPDLDMQPVFEWWSIMIAWHLVYFRERQRQAWIFWINPVPYKILRNPHSNNENKQNFYKRYIIHIAAKIKKKQHDIAATSCKHSADENSRDRDYAETTLII